jgi:hypothetical protein
MQREMVAHIVNQPNKKNNDTKEEGLPLGESSFVYRKE